MAEKLPEIKKSLTENEQTALLLAIAIIFGGWLRLTPMLLVGFPINDGGMFYTMISDLGRNRYSLPEFTTYNGSNIPFAYPPFALYVARILNDTVHVSILDILRWLPALISILVIPAFYLLANQLFQKHLSAAIATIIFSFSPRAISWFIMGGGLTRAFGQLFMLLTLYCASRLFKEASRKNLSLTILFGALTVLSHPEAAVQTAGAAILLWLVTARNKTALISGIKVSIAILALTSIWWATIIYQHGLVPLLKAGQTGFSGLALALVPFYFTDEIMMTVISVLGIIGLFAQLSRREFFLPLWILAAFLIDPRSAPWVANFSLCMLGAVAINEIILPGLVSRSTRSAQPGFTDSQGKLASQLFIGYILAYLLMTTYFSTLTLSNIHLGEDYKTAMTWVKENTPTNSRFILLTPGTDYPMRDPVQEWFPALSERISLTTIQGQEWILGPNFSKAMSDYKSIQTCATQSIDCLTIQAIIPTNSIDYIFISKSINDQDCGSAINCQQAQIFILSVQKTGKFNLVYENNSVVIFKQN